MSHNWWLIFRSTTWFNNWITLGRSWKPDKTILNQVRPAFNFWKISLPISKRIKNRINIQISGYIQFFNLRSCQIRKLPPPCENFRHSRTKFRLNFDKISFFGDLLSSDFLIFFDFYSKRFSKSKSSRTYGGDVGKLSYFRFEFYQKKSGKRRLVEMHGPQFAAIFLRK